MFWQDAWLEMMFRKVEEEEMAGEDVTGIRLHAGLARVADQDGISIEGRLKEEGLDKPVHREEDMMVLFELVYED